MEQILEREFTQYMIQKNLATNTIKSYLFTLEHYCRNYNIEKITKRDLLKYKMDLIENYRPQTVNLRLRAINCYLEMVRKNKLKLTSIKVQAKTFLENVISEADYEYFKKKLKVYDKFWYFVIRFMAATGARVSELLSKVANRSVGLVGRNWGFVRLYICKSLRRPVYSARNRQPA